tara:strand:- start:660 stop:1094 length:435 start_codon:yes stop_codon:yes gene_type:complete
MIVKKLIIGLILIVFSCKNQEASPVMNSLDDNGFDMYEMSEMAALMEQMYVDNQLLKDRIKKGDSVGKLPNHFLKIHESVMTDESENDSFFKEQSAYFITSQELIYKDPKNAKDHFNKGIDACISCHQVKCTGPISKIKKLYIK